MSATPLDQDHALFTGLLSNQSTMLANDASKPLLKILSTLQYRPQLCPAWESF